MQLSADKNFIEIVNKKPVDQPYNILRADPFTLREKERRYYNKRISQIRRTHSGLFEENDKITEKFQKERTDKVGIENDICLEFQSQKLKRMELKISNSSCHLDDIQSFVYGPFTSRFWLMRKHINLMSALELRQ